MIAYWQQRKRRRQVQELLRHARHVRHMRDDVMSAAMRGELRAAESALRTAAEEGHTQQARDEAYQALEALLVRVMPARPFPGLRENLEVLIVALGVAMACRTYFLQPFKIPTGSMQPTLYGIVYEDRETPSLADKYPTKLIKYIITGDWYLEVRTRQSGYIEALQRDHEDSSLAVCRIAGESYRIPLALAVELYARSSEPPYITKGTVLWRGIRKSGDHVFVDRLRWNLRPPKRGQIVVFNTDNIPGLQPKMHYIKRLVGLPNERLSIRPPDLLIDGQPCLEPESIARIARQDPGYAGYQLVDGLPPQADITGHEMLRTRDVTELGPDDFFALGDNTRNSRDGRYWGPVPRENLVGPAVVIYWPFTKRWGFAD